MGQGDRLRLLQMGEAGHKGIEIDLHHSEQLLQQVSQQAVHFLNFIPRVKLHIQRHLVVAAAARVKPFSRLAHAIGQSALHKGVDIFISGIG